MLIMVQCPGMGSQSQTGPGRPKELVDPVTIHAQIERELLDKILAMVSGRRNRSEVIRDIIAFYFADRDNKK